MEDEDRAEQDGEAYSISYDGRYVVVRNSGIGVSQWPDCEPAAGRKPKPGKLGHFFPRGTLPARARTMLGATSFSIFGHDIEGSNNGHNGIFEVVK
jgi:hypothetical protein